MSDTTDASDLTEAEIEALHHLQLGKENVHKAHGHLIEFHHKIGRSMDHFDEAASLLAASGSEEAADDLRAVMDLGVVPGRWSWWVVDQFEDHFLETVLGAEREVRATVGGESSRRHLAEREMERDARATSEEIRDERGAGEPSERSER